MGVLFDKKAVVGTAFLLFYQQFFVKFKLMKLILKSVFFIFFIVTSNYKSSAQCVANFSSSIGSGGNVNFTSTSVGTTSVTNYNWTFGDGNSFSAFNNPLASHTYSYNGIFSVFLMIKDTISTSTCFDTITKTFTVTTAPCSASPSISYNLTAGGIVNLWNANYLGIAPYSTYNWSFGDGTSFNSGNSIGTAHTYSASGVYNCTLTITDPLSICIYTLTQPVNVSIITCSLTSNYTYTNVGSGILNFSSTSVGTSTSTTYSWDFGDYTSASVPNVSHTYLYNGTYSVTLSVYDSILVSCSNVFTQTINVSNVPCLNTSSFTMYKDSFIALNWHAVPIYPLNVSNATWYWGDGSNTVGLFPTHTYSAAGFYNVCVTVSVSCGPLTSTFCVLSSIYKTTANSMGMITLNVDNILLANVNSLTMNDVLLNIYPNPNNGQFKIEMKSPNLKVDKVQVNIFNSIGEKIFIGESVTDNGTLNYDLDLKNYPAGIYFIQSQIGDRIYTSKIVVDK